MSLSIIDFNGNLWTCGKNYHGQLGLGDYWNKDFFEKVETSEQTAFKKVSLNEMFMVALDYNGSLWSCGNNEYGQLGKGFTNERDETNKGNTILRKIETNVKFIDIAIGTRFFFAIDNKGYLWSCGDNHNGQLGQNEETEYIPILTRLPNDNKFLSVSCGINHTLAIDKNNNLWGCGFNNYHQLGLNVDDYFYEMVSIKLNFSVLSINCGAYYSFLVDEEGNLWCAGDNNSGELGLGNHSQYENVRTFTKVKSNTFFDVVSCGYNSTLALDINGNVWSTGYNEQGQLGLGDHKNRDFFTKINHTNIKSISCSEFYSLILDENNNLLISGYEPHNPLFFEQSSQLNNLYFVKILSDVNLLPDQN